MEPGTLQKVTAGAAVGALVFSLLGWQAAKRAERTAQDAYSAASVIDTSGASYEVEQLTDALVAAGVIDDPMYAHLVGASQVTVAREVCGFLDLEGRSVVATTAAEAKALVAMFPDDIGVVHEAVGRLEEAAGVAAYLDDAFVEEGLRAVAIGWREVALRTEAAEGARTEAEPRPDEAEDGEAIDYANPIPAPSDEEIEEVWAELGELPAVAAVGQWVDRNC